MQFFQSVLKAHDLVIDESNQLSRCHELTPKSVRRMDRGSPPSFPSSLQLEESVGHPMRGQYSPTAGNEHARRQ